MSLRTNQCKINDIDMLQAIFSSIFVTQIKIICVINHLKIYKVTFLKSKSIT